MRGRGRFYGPRDMREGWSLTRKADGSGWMVWESVVRHEQDAKVQRDVLGEGVTAPEAIMRAVTGSTL